jgi:hypothetical protein
VYNFNYYKKIDYTTVKSLTNTRIVERYIIMQSTNVNIIRQSLTLEKYREYILYIVNRVISEDLFIIEGIHQYGKVVFSLRIKQCEWYDELDESVKIDTETNLKRHIFMHFHASRLLLEKNTVCRGNGILTDRYLNVRYRQPVKI